VLIISCSQQNTKWKGTMEEVDGVTIVKIPLGFFPRTWKNKKLYTIEEDEESYLYVKRYKVTWKL